MSAAPRPLRLAVQLGAVLVSDRMGDRGVVADHDVSLSSGGCPPDLLAFVRCGALPICGLGSGGADGGHADVFADCYCPAHPLCRGVGVVEGAALVGRGI
jgi:hypothetical protein